jgi:hypothetical protein
MNKQQLYTAGSVLLATTALSGVANAGSIQGGFAAATACTSITPLTTKIILDGCGGLSNKVAATNGANTNTSASYAGVIFSGVSFNNASGLAAVGGTIGVSGIVYNANNPSQQFETIAATNVITSAAPVSASITNLGDATVVATSTPVAFSYFTVATNIASLLTVTLATVDISGTGVLLANLTTVANPSVDIISSVQVTVTSGALSQAAVQAVSVNTGAGVQNATVANFSSGVATFSINAAAGFTSFTISVAFSGTTALAAASAGTVAVTFGVSNNTPVGQALPAISGKTAAISLGGFNAELNTFLGSSNTSFSSFARIHNNGIIAAPAVVTVRNDATGATMGTYTTAAIATNQTLQISAKDIETGAGITAAAGLNYTLSISGAFSGYAQHIIFNPATGQLADLSSFRNKGTTGGVTAP